MGTPQGLHRNHPRGMEYRIRMDPRRIPAPSHRSARRRRPSGTSERQGLRLPGPHACRIPRFDRPRRQAQGHAAKVCGWHARLRAHLPDHSVKQAARRHGRIRAHPPPSGQHRAHQPRRAAHRHGHQGRPTSDTAERIRAAIQGITGLPDALAQPMRQLGQALAQIGSLPADPTNEPTKENKQ